MAIDRLVMCGDKKADKGRLYAIINGDSKRHLIYHPIIYDFLKADEQITCDIELLCYEDIRSMPLSFPVISQNYIDYLSRLYPNLPSSIDARCYFSQFLHGYGLEFGGADVPFPLLPHCNVQYVDKFQDDEGCKTLMPDKNFVAIDIASSLDTFENIDRGAQYDFIVASHVMEHVPRTLLALQYSYEALKPGGVFLAIVPHMRRTFDKYRKLTPLSHFILDYKNYSRQRDVIDIADYLAYVSVKHNGEEPDIHSILESIYSAGFDDDYHYHTFTENTFDHLLEWFNNHVYRWSGTKVWTSFEYGNNKQQSHEFFVLLRK